jgi:23S rRNA pseudouridine2604 synthase
MMASGVKIMGEMTKPCKVARIDAETLRMTLTQGLNRQIRRMCSALGYRARRLQRVRIINIELGELALGEWRYLTAAEVLGLLRPQPPLAAPSRPRVQGRLLRR